MGMEANFSGEGKQESTLSAIAEAEKVLERLDTPALEQIFDELREHSGAQDKSTFQDPRYIHIDPSLPHLGICQSDGSIVMNPLAIERDLGNDALASDIRREVLRTLIHEETHAVSNGVHYEGAITSRIVKFVADMKQRSTTLSVSGFRRHVYDPTTPPDPILGWELKEHVEFNFFNEGVTEKIARQIFDEYLRRTGDRAHYLDKHGSIPESPYYENLVHFADLFIATLAHATGVPQEHVWDAVIAGYMRGLDLRGTELKQFFEETFGTHLVHLMERGFPTPKDFTAAISSLSVNEEQRSVLRDTLESLETKSFHRKLGALGQVSEQEPELGST